MENKIVLSIAVTTYNRPGFLKSTVDKSIKQIIDGRLQNEVEIIISNDASPDKDTIEYINKVDSEYEFVRGFNQPKNLGVSKNLEWVVNESRGSHVELVGDDDLLADGAIAYFVKSIKEKIPNFIMVNINNIHSLDDRSNQNYKIVLENRLNISNDIFVNDIEKDGDLLKPIKNWLYTTNFITAMIFRKDLWQKEMITAKTYMDPKNVFIWQAPVVMGIAKYGKILFIAKPFILCRKNPTDNYVLDPRGRWHINLFESIAISPIVKKYIPSEYKKHKKMYAAFIMQTFMEETLKGRKIRKFALIASRSYFDLFPENLQFLSMAIMPKTIAKNQFRLRTLKKFVRSKI